jgi:hypothetical protein
LEEVSLLESFANFHEKEEPLEEVNHSDSFVHFDDNSTYHVPDKSPEDKIFDFSVEPIDYVDFIRIDAILSNYSNQNCDEIYMVEKVSLSKIERVFVSFLGILIACGKSKTREKHDNSTQERGVWSLSGSSIGCESCFIKWRSQVRIPPPLTLVWTCKKKKTKGCVGTSRQQSRYSDDEEHHTYYEVLSSFDLEEGRVERVDRASEGP